MISMWIQGINILVGGLEHVLFSHISGVFIPTDFHIFQRGRSTTNQDKLMVTLIMFIGKMMISTSGWNGGPNFQTDPDGTPKERGTW